MRDRNPFPFKFFGDVHGLAKLLFEEHEVGLGETIYSGTLGDVFMSFVLKFHKIGLAEDGA